jgi:hypothetical protein
MNTIYKIFKTQLLLAVVLFGASMGFAQVVQVPSGCTVVFAGDVPVGTPAGFVGNNGIVGMPDPDSPPLPAVQVFGGGTFTFVGPVGVTLGTIISWNLRGDLSSTSVTPFYGAVTQPANSATATILSYNKKLRPSEDLAATATINKAKWARSKGRVTVGYSVVNGAFSCGNNVTFDVFKIFTGSVQLNPANIAIQPTNIPKIIGPDCIEVNKSCTFSVDQVASDNASDAIGFDSYYWGGIVNGTNISTISGLTILANSLYYSADNSSVTFTPTAVPAGGFTLKCSVGKLNANVIPSSIGPEPVVGTTYNSSVSKAIGVTPAQSIFPAFGGNPATIPNVVLSTNPLLAPCVDTGVSSFTVYFTGSTGVWTAANTGWTVDPIQYNGTQYYIKVNTPNNNPGELIQTVTNGTCPPVVFRYQVNRKFVSSTIKALGTSSNCLLANTTDNRFSVGDTGLENPITWSLTSNPTGATGVTLAAITGVANSTVAVNITGTATINTEYTLTANATSCAYSPANTSPNFYKFRVQPNVPTITAADGNACVNKGSIAQKTFNCVASTGASYVWQFPAGWSATSFTTTTNSIIVIPSSASAVLDGTVTVTASGIATCKNQATFTIGYTATAPTGVAASCWSTGVAGVNKVTFTDPLPGTYGATLTAVGSTVNLISGAVTLSGTNVLSFNTSNILTAGEQYNITITHNALNGCTPASASSTTLLTVTAGGNVLLTPNPGVGNGDTYQASGGGTYAWYVNNTLIPDNTFSPTVVCSANLLQLKGNGTAPTSVYVIITNGTGSCTTKAVANLATGTGATHSANRQIASIGGTKTVIEEITVYPNPTTGLFTIKLDKVRLLATATLNDATGKEIATYILKKGENKIEKEGLPSGTYSIVFEVDGKTETRQLIIK